MIIQILSTAPAWRDSGGTKLPFVTRWLSADYRVIFTIHDISSHQ